MQLWVIYQHWFNYANNHEPTDLNRLSYSYSWKRLYRYKCDLTSKKINIICAFKQHVMFCGENDFWTVSLTLIIITSQLGSLDQSSRCWRFITWSMEALSDSWLNHFFEPVLCNEPVWIDSYKSRISLDLSASWFSGLLNASEFGMVTLPLC